MSHRYRLIYFNVTALGEPIRYLLSFGGIKFEDYRMEWDEWLQYKSKTTFGQLPILEIDGKPLNQCNAICRFLAKKMDLLGSSQWESIQADAIVDTITDFRMNYRALFQENDETIKKKMLEEIKVTHNPFYLSRFEEIVQKNGGHFVNNKLTWADIYFAAISDLFLKVSKESIFMNYPSLSGLKERVDSLPKIKAYRDNRPFTDI